MLLGATLGFLLQVFAPQAVTDYLCKNLFSSVTDMFMNAIKMIVTPLVFFSIASSVAGFGDIRSLGKTGLKVLSCYLFTALIAILVGLGVFRLFQPGDPALLSAMNNSAESYTQSASAASTSVRAFVVGIIPSNIINAFAAPGMLQVISVLFLAKIFGVSIQGGQLLSLLLTVMVLSLGAPSVPGSCLVCVAMLLPPVGIPMEAISLLIGLYPLAGSMLTVGNCTGDAVITTAIATMEKQIDENIFNAP